MNLLKRDFKFGIDKSKRNILVFIIFIIMPLIVCINFYKDYSYVVSYFILPKLDTRENIFGSNIFFVTLQILVMYIFSSYIYEDLFNYNKLILTRYRSRTSLAVSKMVFICISSTIFISIVMLTIYIGCLFNKVYIRDLYLLGKIFISYSIGAISLGIFNLLVSIKFGEHIGVFVAICSVAFNLVSGSGFLPGGGYMLVLQDGSMYIGGLIYNTILILSTSFLVVFFYKEIDLI